MSVPQLQELTAQCLPFNPSPGFGAASALQEQPGCRQKLPLGQRAGAEEQ